MADYNTRDRPLLLVEFTDPMSGTYTDPDTVTLLLKGPDGNVSIYDQNVITRTAVGRYQFRASCPTAGVWWYRFEGEVTGGGGGAERSFSVADSQFP